MSKSAAQLLYGPVLVHVCESLVPDAVMKGRKGTWEEVGWPARHVQHDKGNNPLREGRGVEGGQGGAPAVAQQSESLPAQELYRSLQMHHAVGATGIVGHAWRQRV